MEPRHEHQPLAVASLVGHRQVELAQTCLGSLLRRSSEPVRLRLHDDGTLTADDRDRLAATLGEPQIVERGEGEALAAAVLARRPALTAFRRENPLALKLIDAVLCTDAEELVFCDTDVLFLRPFAGLGRLLKPGSGAVFMSDRQEAYSVRSWHLLLHRRLRLPRRVNSGLIAFRTRYFDPDLLEWYLGHPEFRFAPVWIEQTCWALLGAGAGCRLIDPALVALPNGPLRPGTAEGRVALHFVSSLRGLLPAYVEKGDAEESTKPVELRTIQTRRCTPMHLAASELRRRWARHAAITTPVPAE